VALGANIFNTVETEHMQKKTYLWLILVFGLITIMGCTSSQTKVEIHEHADFKVYLNGEQYNFSQEKYMDANEEIRGEHTDLHDLNGDAIHKHSSGVTLEIFFESLKMKFNSTCFVTDNLTSYCNSGDKQIKLYVNGVENHLYEKYLVKDLDRILITYGDENQDKINRQFNSVTDKACIYSEKCPERGVPPDESSCSGQGVCRA